MKAVDGVTFDDDQSYGKHCSEPCKLGEEYKNKSNDNRICRFCKKAKIQLVHCFIDLVEVVDGDEVEFEELIAQIKIHECKVDHKKDYRKCELGIKNQKDKIKKEKFHSVGYDVDLRPKNGFLLEEPRKTSICDISDPMNDQADIVICLVHFHDRQRKKDKRTHKPDQGNYIRNAKNAFRRKRRKYFYLLTVIHSVCTPGKKLYFIPK